MATKTKVKSKSVGKSKAAAKKLAAKAKPAKAAAKAKPAVKPTAKAKPAAKPKSKPPIMAAHLLAHDELGRMAAADSIKHHPDDPLVVCSYLITHLDDATAWTKKRRTPADPETLRAVATTGSEMRSDDPSLQRSLRRTSHLALALLGLEEQPTAEQLAEAVSHLDAYESARGEPFDHGRDEKNLVDRWYKPARTRAQSWKLLLHPTTPDEDFAFIAGLSADDLKWGLDPLVASPGFQAWARDEIRERRVTQPQAQPINFRADMQMRWEATGSPRQMVAIIMGRLLAAQLAGLADPVTNARGLHEASTKSRMDPAPLLRQLIAAGLDPNAIWNPGNKETLLHDAAKQGDLEAVQVYVAAGANREAVDGSGRTPAQHTTNAKIKSILGGKAPAYELKKRPPDIKPAEFQADRLPPLLGKPMDDPEVMRLLYELGGVAPVHEMAKLGDHGFVLFFENGLLNSVRIEIKKEMVKPFTGTLPLGIDRAIKKTEVAARYPQGSWTDGDERAFRIGQELLLVFSSGSGKLENVWLERS